MSLKMLLNYPGWKTQGAGLTTTLCARERGCACVPSLQPQSLFTNTVVDYINHGLFQVTECKVPPVTAYTCSESAKRPADLWLWLMEAELTGRSNIGRFPLFASNIRVLQQSMVSYKHLEPAMRTFASSQCYVISTAGGRKWDLKESLASGQLIKLALRQLTPTRHWCQLCNVECTDRPLASLRFTAHFIPLMWLSVYTLNSRRSFRCYRGSLTLSQTPVPSRCVVANNKYEHASQFHPAVSLQEQANMNMPLSSIPLCRFPSRCVVARTSEHEHASQFHPAVSLQEQANMNMPLSSIPLCRCKSKRT
ncbi:hypothetical protein J6590_079766 [Homalodisca vitripennis]|nr:hypothetical protein J6590_079766 [Homalodisca vitripennis]